MREKIDACGVHEVLPFRDAFRGKNTGKVEAVVLAVVAHVAFNVATERHGDALRAHVVRFQVEERTHLQRYINFYASTVTTRSY